MQILTWNIQATRGCDGRDDMNRILSVIGEFGASDVICLQEVSRFFPEYGGDDQLLKLQSAFPGHEAVWGPVLSWPDGKRRKEFGNITLVRKDLLLDWRIHPLPRPWPGQLWQMPRNAVEVVVAAGDRNIAILNTHLAFHAEEERGQQVQALTDIKDAMLSWQDQADKCNKAIGPGAYASEAMPTDVILCGDLNLAADSPQYLSMTGQGGWNDAWTICHNGKPHASTCGIFDQQQWPEGPHCRDFLMLSERLVQNLAGIDVNTETDASDHQPVLLQLDY